MRGLAQWWESHRPRTAQRQMTALYDVVFGIYVSEDWSYPHTELQREMLMHFNDLCEVADRKPGIWNVKDQERKKAPAP